MLIRDVVLEEDKQQVIAFLKTVNLHYENDIEESIVLVEDDHIIATASRSHNIIKCVAIDPTYQGQNLLSTLMTEMIKRLHRQSFHHYFVYTLDEQAPMFRALGLNTIVQTMTMTLLEGGRSITEELTKLKKDYHLSEAPKACVVINANPMTNGHFHLIKTATENHQDVLVFVVSEERSTIPFKMRFAIVKKACEIFKNVTVVPSLDYLVSYATFPKYFLKNETTIREEHALIDVMIFKKYYMKIFNIQKRYVGEEPLSPMTDIYNQTMHKYLNSQFEIIPRITFKDLPISASTVRKLLKQNGLESIKPYVPRATFDMLASEEGRDLIERLKHHNHRH